MQPQVESPQSLPQRDMTDTISLQTDKTMGGLIARHYDSSERYPQIFLIATRSHNAKP
jgi:hypothetical protein